MALQKVKRNKALKNLLDDVAGKKRLQKYPKTFFRGKAGNPQVLKAKKSKGMNPKEQKAFRVLCDKKYKLEQEIHDLWVQYTGGMDSRKIVHPGLIPQVKGRITKSIELYGRKVNYLDSVLYVHPYKTQIEMTAGALNEKKVLSWAKKHMPDLIDQGGVKSLDLLELETLIKKDKSITKFFKEALSIVTKYSEDNHLIQEIEGERLNPEKYKKAKKNGQIPRKLIEAVESEYTPRLTVRRLLDAKPRCPGCGVETSRANKPDFSCDNCGFGLKMVKRS